VRQRQRPCLRSCANIPDWESCATVSTMRSDSARGSVVSSGQLKRAASGRRAWLPAPIPPKYVAPPLAGLVGSQPDAAVRPDRRAAPQLASEAVGSRAATYAGRHSRYHVQTEKPRACSHGAGSDVSSGTDSGMTSPSSGGSIASPGRHRSVSTTFVPAHHASTSESWQSTAVRDWQDDSQRHAQHYVSRSISTDGSMHASRLDSPAPAAVERHMVSRDQHWLSSIDSDSTGRADTAMPKHGGDCFMTAARQTVSGDSSGDDCANAPRQPTGSHALAARNFGRPPSSSASSIAAAEQRRHHHRSTHQHMVASARQRALPSESSFSVGTSDTHPGAKPSTRASCQRAASEPLGLESLSSTSVSSPAAAASPMMPLLSGRMATHDRERHAAHSGSAALAAPSAGAHGKQVSGPSRRRQASQRAAGTVARRQRTVGWHNTAAASGRAGPCRTSVWTPSPSPVRSEYPRPTSATYCFTC